MNDRFKFRMYDTNVNKMYMPNDFEEVESIYECIKQQINWDLDVDYDIKFNHLEDGRFFMQCTGLKDKNGKLIYERDVVKDISLNMIFEVGYKKCAFYLENEEHIGYFHELATAYSEKRLEVIGNIYENKSLLESEG